MPRYRPKLDNDPDEVRIPIGGTMVHYGLDSSDIRDDHWWYRVKCPFHGDDHPSASLNTELHLFRCHTCDYRGNAAQLIMKREALSYAEAQARAAEYAGTSYDGVHAQPASRFRVSRGTRDQRGRGRYRRSWGG